ncbi:50S ribosomal protein L1 [Candidatus Saccharibacteria bacterium]|nr:50S ribosomal protein L1 [Candidatus Saccharibacteria bacterium]
MVQANTKKAKPSTKATQKPAAAAKAAPVKNRKPQSKPEGTAGPVKTTATARPPAPTLAKAGKRSAKAVGAAEAAAAKKERHAADKTSGQNSPLPVSKPPRSRLERAGKKYRELAKQIDSSRSYPLAEVLALAVKTSPTKFDATVELHINLAVNPTQADQNVRGTVVLPAGSGKTVKVAVLASDEDAEQLFQKLDKGNIDFDSLVATPAMMPKLGKYAKLLGPKGLMPNPKSGTVTTEPAKVVKEMAAGRLEYRVDAAGIIHLAVGKVSFGADKLLANTEAVLGSIRSAKPASVKGAYVKSVFAATSMGPSLRIDLTSLS